MSTLHKTLILPASQKISAFCENRNYIILH